MLDSVRAAEEADLGAAVGDAEAADVEAEAVAEACEARGLVDVAAHEDAAVPLGPLADGRAADMEVAGGEVERGVPRRGVAEEDIAVRDYPRADLVLAPFVGKSEPIRPGAADSGDAQVADPGDPAVDVPFPLEIPGIVVARHPEKRKPRRADALQHVHRRTAVEHLHVGRRAGEEPEPIRAQVADEENPVGPFADDPLEDERQMVERAVDVADHAEDGHVR